MINQLGEQIQILENIENASRLFSGKITDMRSRLAVVEDTLLQVQQSTKEMKDNTSNKDEDDFIELFKEEAPECFNQISNNYKSIDDLEAKVQDVVDSKNIEKIQTLSAEEKGVQSKVLENEKSST